MKKAMLLGLVAAAACLYSCNRTKRKDMEKHTGPITIKDGPVTIAYTDTKVGDTTLLFVHGWALNGTYWADQISHFQNHYRVVTMDLPGFSGRSGKNRDQWNTAAYAADVQAVIDQLKLRNVILVGHSMAGDIVLEALIDRPDEVIGLVGVDNFKNVGIAPADPKAVARDYDEAIAAMRSHFTSYATRYFNDALFYSTTSPALKSRILADLAKSDSVIAVKAMEPDTTFDEATKLAESGKKLYLINSDYQPTDTLGLSKKKLPFKVYFIRTTGHFPMAEKPAAFNDALELAIADMRANP